MLASFIRWISFIHCNKLKSITIQTWAIQAIVVSEVELTCLYKEWKVKISNDEFSRTMILINAVHVQYTALLGILQYTALLGIFQGVKTVLMIRFENCPDIYFPIIGNLLTSPLIMYS